jgi:hypothetical protein
MGAMHYINQKEKIEARDGGEGGREEGRKPLLVITSESIKDGLPLSTTRA